MPTAKPLVADAAGVTHAKADPFHCKYCPDKVGASAKAVVPDDELYTSLLAAPPATLVAVVAVVALPLKAAVIVPALKLPEASLATTLDAVLADVASTANVRATDPSNVPPLVRYVPAVRALATDPAEPEMFPFTSEPLTTSHKGA